MQRKILYTALLMLCLGSVASPHDQCSWPGVPFSRCKTVIKTEPASSIRTSPASREVKSATQGGAENESPIEFSLARILFV